MMLTIEELKKYEWIQFYDCRTNVKDRKTGARVGRYMACSGYDNKWRLFQIYGGLPVLDLWITSLPDAVKIAQVIEKEYGQYLAIWEVWESINVLEIARLSVDHGEAVCFAIHDLVQLGKDINYNDFYQALTKHITNG
jgi:hypothetical protein